MTASVPSNAVAGTVRRIVLRRRPGPTVLPGDTELVAAPMPEPADGQALIRTELIAMDPVTRVIIDHDIGLVPPIALGDPVRSFAGGVVVRSRNDRLPVGRHVTGFLEWADWQLVAPGPRTVLLDEDVPLVAGLNLHGHTAMAAYFGMTEIGRPAPGEVVVVSGAAGAVGSIASQIAAIGGARVVGIAGGAGKRAWLQERLGLAGAIDHRVPGWEGRLAAECPDGIDVLFDNVGGAMLAATLPLMAPGGRVVACGAISQYATGSAFREVDNPTGVPMLRFNAMTYQPRFDEAAARMHRWERDGRLHVETMFVDGLEQAPNALNMLFDGRSRGRVLIRL